MLRKQYNVFLVVSFNRFKIFIPKKDICIYHVCVCGGGGGGGGTNY